MLKKRHSAMDIANAVAHAVDEMHRTGKAPKAAAPAPAPEGSPAEEASESPAFEASENESPAAEAKETKPKAKTKKFTKGKK